MAFTTQDICLVLITIALWAMLLFGLDVTS